MRAQVPSTSPIRTGTPSARIASRLCSIIGRLTAKLTPASTFASLVNTNHADQLAIRAHQCPARGTGIDSGIRLDEIFDLIETNITPGCRDHATGEGNPTPNALTRADMTTDWWIPNGYAIGGKARQHEAQQHHGVGRCQADAPMPGSCRIDNFNFHGSSHNTGCGQDIVSCRRLQGIDDTGTSRGKYWQCAKARTCVARPGFVQQPAPIARPPARSVAQDQQSQLPQRSATVRQQHKQARNKPLMRDIFRSQIISARMTITPKPLAG